MITLCSASNDLNLSLAITSRFVFIANSSWKMSRLDSISSRFVWRRFFSSFNFSYLSLYDFGITDSYQGMNRMNELWKNANDFFRMMFLLLKTELPSFSIMFGISDEFSAAISFRILGMFPPCARLTVNGIRNVLTTLF